MSWLLNCVFAITVDVFGSIFFESEMFLQPHTQISVCLTNIGKAFITHIDGISNEFFEGCGT